MTPMLSLATRAFEKLMQLRKDAVRTKPTPISIIGAPGVTIKGRETSDK
jgi:hypothetical protein